MALEISLCDMWMENQISYLAQTWHTSEKEKDWSDFKLCLFSHPIFTWYERLLLHSAGRENKWIVQESNFQHINGKLRKMHQNRRLHVKNINSLHSPFGLGQPLTESIAFTEVNDKWRMEVMHKGSIGKEGNWYWTPTNSPCVLLLEYSGDGWEKAGWSHLLEEVA